MKTQITTTRILIVLVVMMSVATATISFAVQASAQSMNTSSTTGTTTVPQVNVTTTPLRGNATTAEPECPKIEAGAAGTCETYCCAVCTACAQRGGLCQECADNCHR